MNGKVGGDLEEMRRMARMFTTNAGRLDGIIKDLNSRTVDSERIWSGPAADQFRGEWEEARGTFERMARSLEEASTSVSRNAHNIEEATRRR